MWGRELAPGRDQASQAVARKGSRPASWRPVGIRPRKLSPGVRDAPLSPRPGQAVAVARVAGMKQVEGSSREGHGTVTGVRRRHEERENSGLPPVLCNTDLRAACIEAPIGAQRHAARFRASNPAGKGPPRAGKCDVPGISVTVRAEVWNLPDGIVTEVRPPPVPAAPPSRKSDFAPSL